MPDIYTLTAKEEMQLEIMIADKFSPRDLVEHYIEVVAIYTKWAEETENYEVRINKKIRKLSVSRIIERIKNNIFDFDGELFRLASHPKLQKKIRVTSYEEICLLFAKNSVASNPVNPEVKK